MKKLITKYLYILLPMLVCLSACERFLDIDNPKAELIASEVLESDLTANAAIANIYSNMSWSAGGISSITWAGGLATDELALFNSSVALNEIYNNNITPVNTVVTSLWNTSGYNYIYQVNALLEGLETSDKVTPPVRDRLKGEALFLRAYLHFNLVNVFGDIPYITSTDYRINTASSRTPQQQVYNLIVEDLKMASEKLPEDFAFAGNERIKPNKWAAIALLARVSLFQQNWTQAEYYSSLLIANTTLFQLTSLNDVFLKNSRESIWQLKPVDESRTTNEGFFFILTGAPQYVTLTNSLATSFETGDQRRTSWVNSITVGTNTYYYSYKYKIRTGSAAWNEYTMVMRLAEQILIRAEARTQLNNLTGAVQDLDAIRQRCNLPSIKVNYPAITREEMLLAVEKERRSELFTEWAHRWMDLKRTSRINDVLKNLKSGWESTDALFPLPNADVLVNTNLKQNPGY